MNIVLPRTCLKVIIRVRQIRKAEPEDGLGRGPSRDQVLPPHTHEAHIQISLERVIGALHRRRLRCCRAVRDRAYDHLYVPNFGISLHNRTQSRGREGLKNIRIPMRHRRQPLKIAGRIGSRRIPRLWSQPLRAEVPRCRSCCRSLGRKRSRSREVEQSHWRRRISSMLD